MGLETPLPPEDRPKSDAGEAARAESHAPSAAPEPPATTPDLPDFAKKASDLEEIKKAVEDAASVSGALWFSYLFVLFYFAIAAGAVTHADLFFENPVKLPILSVDLPLLAFFFLAPILFVIIHAYILVHLVMLTDKAKRYHQALHRQIEDDAIRNGLRKQLPSNVFVQFLAGAPETREGPFGWILRAIGWTTLVIGPVLLLLLIQIQFLPFHNSFITWTHRLALLADLLLIWWLWRRILSGREVDGPRSRQLSRLSTTLGVTFSACALIASWALATFPGEWQEGRLAAWKPIHDHEGEGEFRRPVLMSVHDWLFHSRMDDTTHRRRLPLSSTLVLPDLNVYEALKIDDPEKTKWRDYVFRARGRDLKGAIFSLATLPKVDFDGAQLQGAALVRSNFQGASLKDAQLQGAFLAEADLRGASLDRAQLQGAHLGGARLQGAHLGDAQLQGAHLGGAQLQGARLGDAQLQGASLDDAQLQGAALDSAQLQGASLDGAQLQGASLDGAQLQGASLDGAQLQGASLDGVQLQGAALDSAQLQGASLDSAQLQGVSLPDAVLEVTDLSDARLWRANSPTPPSKVSALGMPSGDDTWQPEWEDQDGNPQPWDDKAYQDLREQMESLPANELRDQAVERISRLDCANPNPTLASCEPNAPAPPEAIAWRKTLEAASVEKKVYAEALAKTLRGLVCSGGDDAIHVVRGEGFQGRLKAAGAAASDLMDDLMNKDSKGCPVSASLTDADRARLLQVKRDAENADK